MQSSLFDIKDFEENTQEGRNWPENHEEVLKLFHQDKQKDSKFARKIKFLHFLMHNNLWNKFMELNSRIISTKNVPALEKRGSVSPSVNRILSEDHFPALLYNTKDSKLGEVYLQRIFLNDKLEVTKSSTSLMGACILSQR